MTPLNAGVGRIFETWKFRGIRYIAVPLGQTTDTSYAERKDR